MFEQEKQVVMDDDTFGSGHAVHHGSDLYRKTHKDAADKGEISVSEIQHHHHVEIDISSQSHQYKSVSSSSIQPEGTSKSSVDGDEIKNYINKCNVNAANKDAGREDNFENEVYYDLQALEDEFTEYEEECSDEELEKKNIPDVEDLPDVVDIDKVEKLKYDFDGYNINQDFPNELMIDYYQWIAVGLLKTHFAKKEMDNHYQVNAYGDCGVFVCVYAEILSEGLQVHSCGFDSACQRARYASLLWHYEVEKANEGYTSDNGDPPRPRKSVIEEIEVNAIVTLE
ncbi:hypothetical protein BC332_13835 [Capsicum chinense]|nr:hypothetical protein BC332_13835 [Capsicum chinense]